MNSMQEPESYSGVDYLELMQGARNYNRYLRDTVRKYAPAPGAGRILDFGAGADEFAEPLRALGFDVTALEPEPLLRSRLQAQRIPVIAGPAELPDNSISYAYTLNVLEHIEDDVGALRALRSKLAARATLLIYVPAFSVLYTSMAAKVGHLRRYTRKSLTAAVSAAGFDIEDVGYVDSLGFVASLLFKSFDNGSGSVSVRALRLYDRVAFPISRAIDVVARRWIGKNLLLIARRPAGPG